MNASRVTPGRVVRTPVRRAPPPATSPSTSGDTSESYTSTTPGEILPVDEKKERKLRWSERTVLSPPSVFRPAQKSRKPRCTVRMAKFENILAADIVDLDQLREISWSGIPDGSRARVWKLLLGYTPAARVDRDASLHSKRAQYLSLVRRHFDERPKQLSEFEGCTLHQVELDSPRTNPSLRLYQRTETQKCLERIMYLWALQHPQTGYVQGMMDLATPFFTTFLVPYVEDGENVEDLDTGKLKPWELSGVEADTFWCTSQLLASIQDNFSQTLEGVQHMANKMRELVRLVDPPLFAFLSDYGIEIQQFSWRWMICLLTRELPARIIPRMWDAYLAEPDLGMFHVYVCVAFLRRWSDHLQAQVDFNNAMLFLQNLPTREWTDEHIAVLLSEAHVVKSLYHETNGMVRLEAARAKALAEEHTRY